MLHQIYSGSTATGDGSLSVMELIERSKGKKRSALDTVDNNLFADEEDVVEETQLLDTPPESTPCGSKNRMLRIKRSRIDKPAVTPATLMAESVTGLGKDLINATKLLMASDVNEACEDFLASFSGLRPEDFVLAGITVLSDNKEAQVYMRLLSRPVLKESFNTKRIQALHPETMDTYVTTAADIRGYRLQRRSAPSYPIPSAHLRTSQGNSLNVYLGPPIVSENEL
jgi:hypothetical protein